VLCVLDKAKKPKIVRFEPRFLVKEDEDDYLEVSEDALYAGKYKSFIVRGGDLNRFDMDAYSKQAEKLQEEEDFCIDAVNFAEFIMEIIGKDVFWKSIPTMKRQEVKRGIERCRFSFSIAEMIEEIFSEAWRLSYENYEEVEEKPEYVPFEERVPLTASFMIGHYWHQKKTTEEISRELNVPEGWIQKEIRRLGVQKRENGIKLKGRKGYIMPEAERKKHRVQPHAKPVVQISPKTFRTVKEYSSTGAVERHGFRRENVRKAIKSAGLHNGYLWAHKGLEKPIIESAKKRGNLQTKLQASAYKRPTKTQLKKLYIDNSMTASECAEIFRCNKGTIAVLAMNYGLKKRTKKVSIDELKHLYLEEGLQAKEIAERVGATAKTVSTYLSKNGIRKRDKEGDMGGRA